MLKQQLVPFLFFLFLGTAFGQAKFNAPYTRYGMGDLFPSQLAVQTGRAGLTAAYNDPFHLNLANPASFAALRTSTLETGLYGEYSQYKSNTSSLNQWNGNLSYFALGFTLLNPINEALERKRSNWRHGMGFSLTPYSSVGYNIETLDTLPELGIVRSKFEGKGGTHKLVWHAGSKYKNTAFGASAGYIFGRSRYENTTTFLDSLPTFQNNFFDEYKVGGLVWNLGFQQDIVLERLEADRSIPKRWFTLGLTGHGAYNLTTSADIVRLRSRGRQQSGAYTDADTLLIATGAQRELVLPASWSLGLDYVVLDKWRIGAQVGMDTWSQYLNEVRPAQLRNAFHAAAGVEIIPDAYSYNKYTNRIRYNFGAYYRQDPRVVAGKNLDDVGITLGFGFPLILPRQQTSFINLAFEAGRFGMQSPIEETYIRLTMGFTLNDNSWFFKRRFE